MSDTLTILKEIREELKEIKLLYKELVEKLVPVEEPLEDEKEAIESSDEVVGEEEIECLEMMFRVEAKKKALKALEKLNHERKD
jgi:hypothetical protein